MAYRTLQTHGVLNSDEAAALITVDNQIIHTGPLPKQNSLFQFITDVKFHGKVHVKIEMIYGSMTITHVRAVYSATINRSPGFVSFIQPIKQPLYPLVMPLTINHALEYDHYMINGPEEWIVDQDVDQQYLEIDNVLKWQDLELIRANWNYRAQSFDEKLLHATQSTETSET